MRLNPVVALATGALTLFLLNGIPAADELPQVGERHDFQGTKYLVVGAGTQRMEYEAVGGSIVIVIDVIDPVGVIVPPAGSLVVLDPALPMLWTDGQEDASFAGNSHLRETGKGKHFMLLQYDSTIN